MLPQIIAATSAGIIACALSIASSTARAEEQFADLGAYVERAMGQWEVPGLALAIVKDGEPVFVRGYGFCKLGDETPVTANTPFAIGSCTKAFTATAIARLVDEGRLGWDDPVRKHLPRFELSDPFLTREVTIRDLLAHRTGLELADLLWSSNHFTPDQIMQRLRYVKSARSFRSGFSYNNLMYLAAARVGEEVSSQSWAQSVQQRIFKPLKMASSTIGPPSAVDFAWPHGEVEGKIVPLKGNFDYAKAVDPAGAIWSNASDMSKWVLWNLSVGEEDFPLLRHETLREMHSPQVIIPVRGNQGSRYPAKEYASCGLGWFVEDYRGKKLVRHGGSRNGYIAWISMLPTERFGCVILANSHQTGINFALHHRILDEFLGHPAKDWSTIVLDGYENGWKKALRESRLAYEGQRVADTEPNLPLSGYVGTYRNELFGELVVRESERGLQFQFGPRRTATLRHWQDNTFEARFNNPVIQDWHLTFAIDSDKVVSVRAVAAPWAPSWFDDRSVVGEFRRLP